MSELLDRNNIAGGDPQRIREEAARLRAQCEHIDMVSRLLRDVSTRGVWDSDAGEAFAAQVGAVPADLDAVCGRLHDAAVLLPPYADLLEQAQRRMRRVDEEYARARRTMEERDRQLEVVPPDNPDRARLVAERGEAATRSHQLQEAFIRESDEIRADEKRLAAKLHDVRPELSDPKGYDVWEGLTNAGEGANESELGLIAKPIAVAGVLEPIGRAGRVAFYDEGSWADVEEAARWYAFGGLASFGAGKVAKGSTRYFPSGAPPPKPTSNRFPARARSAVTNPWSTNRRRDISGARTRLGRAAQTAKHDLADATADAVRRRTGIADIEEYAQDWQAVAGSTAGKVVFTAAHSTKHAARVAQQVDVGVRQAQALDARSRRATDTEAPQKSVATRVPQ